MHGNNADDSGYHFDNYRICYFGIGYEMSVDKDAAYYDAGGIETIEIIRAKLTPEQFKGFLLGNAIKYTCRYNFKGQADRDSLKAGIYIGLLNEIQGDV